MRNIIIDLIAFSFSYFIQHLQHQPCYQLLEAAKAAMVQFIEGPLPYYSDTVLHFKHVVGKIFAKFNQYGFQHIQIIAICKNRNPVEPKDRDEVSINCSPKSGIN